MRFLDYNGTGGLDPQDITTSVATGNATEEESSRDDERSDGLQTNAGCATLAALMFAPALMLLLAL